MQVDNDFYINLNSESPLAYPGSDQNNFRLKLRNFVDLSDGKWKVALKSFFYRRVSNDPADKQKGVWPINTTKSARIEIYHVQSAATALGPEEWNIHVNKFGVTELQDELKNELRKKYRDQLDPKMLRKWGMIHPVITTFDIEPNFYATPGEMANDIVVKFKDVRKNYVSKGMELNSDYDPRTNTVRISGADAIVLIDSNHLIKGMGLQDGIARAGGIRRVIDDKYWKFYGTVYGVDGKPPESTEVIHVLSRTVDFSRVNSDMIELLTTIPVKIFDEDGFDYVPINPEYKNVKEQILSDVDIQLMDTDLKPINLNKGKVGVNLHFKKYLSIK